MADVSDDVLGDLAPTGRLRAAINFGNTVLAQRGPNGEPRGVSVDLAAALAKRLGVPVDYVTFEAAGKAFEAIAGGAVDIGFVAIDPERGQQIDFTAPYVVIEGTYMVPADSPLKDVGDVDKPGVRIGVGLNSVYDLFLRREIKHATLVHAAVGGASARLSSMSSPRTVPTGSAGTPALRAALRTTSVTSLPVSRLKPSRLASRSNPVIRKLRRE